MVKVFPCLKICPKTQSLLLCLLRLISNYVEQCPGSSFFAEITLNKWYNPSKKAVTALTQLWKWNFTYILSLDNNFLKTHSLAWDNFWRLKPLLKWRKMLFISRWKLFSFLRYLHFCPDFLVMQKNSLKRKLWLISQTVTDWIVNIYNIHITQYLKK